MNRATRIALLLLLVGFSLGPMGASTSTGPSPAYDPLSTGLPEWERLFGPPGGYIERIGQCAASPDVLYAAVDPRIRYE